MIQQINYYDSGESIFDNNYRNVPKFSFGKIKITGKLCVRN